MSIERRLTALEKELRPQPLAQVLDVARIKKIAMDCHKVYGDGGFVDWDNFGEAEALEHETAFYKGIAEVYEVSYEEALKDCPYKDLILQNIHFWNAEGVR